MRIPKIHLKLTIPLIKLIYVLGVGEVSTLIPLSLLLDWSLDFLFDGCLAVPSVLFISFIAPTLTSEFSLFSSVCWDTPRSFWLSCCKGSRQLGLLWLDTGVDVRGFLCSVESRLARLDDLILSAPSECSAISTLPTQNDWSSPGSVSFSKVLDILPLLLVW